MRRFVLGSLAAVVVGALVFLFALRVVQARKAQAASARPVAVPLPVVTTARVTRRDLVTRVQYTATLRPETDDAVYSKVTGRAEQVLVDVGDPVKAGQLLVVVDHEQLAWQSAQADAQVQVAEAAVAQARIGVATAERAYDRAKALRARNVISPADFDQASSTLESAQASERTAEAQVAAARSGAGLAAATLADSRIVSPIDGVVTSRTVQVGAQVSPAQPLLEVQDVAHLEVQGTVEAEDFLRLRRGQAATITVDDLPGKTFQGEVAALSPSLDPVTRRAVVKVRLANQGGQLLPNMFAHVTVDVGEMTGALAVPAAALVTTGDGDEVYELADGRARLVRPGLGPTDGSYRVITSGLADGDIVLVSGQTGLADGAAVSVAMAAARPAPRP